MQGLAQFPQHGWKLAQPVLLGQFQHITGIAAGNDLRAARQRTQRNEAVPVEHRPDDGDGADDRERGQHQPQQRQVALVRIRNDLEHLPADSDQGGERQHARNQPQQPELGPVTHGGSASLSQ